MPILLVTSKIKPNRLINFSSVGKKVNFFSLRIPFLEKTMVLDFLDFKYEIAGSGLSFDKRLRLFCKLLQRMGIRGVLESRSLNRTYVIIFRNRASNIGLNPLSKIDVWVSLQARANGFLGYIDSPRYPIHARGGLDFCLYFMFNLNKKISLGGVKLRNSLCAYTNPAQIVSLSDTPGFRRNLRDATVLHGNSVLWKNQQILTGGLGRSLLEFFPDYRVSIIKNSTLRIPTRDVGSIQRGIFMDFSFNWYHFWVENFPELLFNLEKSDLTRQLIVNSKVPKQILQILTRVFSADPILVPGDSRLLVEDLACISVVPQNGQVDYFNNDYRENPFLGRLKEMTLSQRWVKSNFTQVQTSGWDRVFIRRTSDSFRNLENRFEVEKMFEDLGFKLIDPASLDFAEQLQYFMGAKIISGEAGAGLTNLLFANPGSSVLILNSHDDGEDSNFWMDFAQGLCIKAYQYAGLKSAGYSYSGSWFAEIEQLRLQVEEIISV